MSQTKPERNKALVLEAFDTLFNKRDYVAAERYWSPTYIQHSAHIAPARIEPEIGAVLPMERAEEALRAMWEGRTRGKSVFTR